MERRCFISQLGAGLTSYALAGSATLSQSDYKGFHLSSDAPVAIAMWDFSWLLRQYEGGGFENWDKALDELEERGYNALRIDCFPQFISEDDNGHVQNQYHLPKKGWHPTLWGNAYTINVKPKPDLINFIKKCQERNIYLVLSSWFYGHGTQRNKDFKGSNGLVRAWDGVLNLLSKNELLQNVLYVDILNEYPLWHGYQWLTDKLNSIQNNKHPTFDFLNKSGKRQFNNQQIKFYNDFINKVIADLKTKWPRLKFMASQTNTLNTPWQDLDTSAFEVLDIHLWMVYNQSFSKYSKYFSQIHTLRNDSQFEETYSRMKNYWSAHKSELIDWMSASMLERKHAAGQNKIPFGSTEGWGSVIWMDHPHLDWEFIKETGIKAAYLGVEHGYSFNCTSNFTHPHFKLWNDINWHKETTRIIRKL